MRSSIVQSGLRITCLLGSGGHGLSDSVGMAGYPDLDVVRVGLVSQTAYIARAMIREVIPLSDERLTQGRVRQPSRWPLRPPREG
jgi:hypothetical protein